MSSPWPPELIAELVRRRMDRLEYAPPRVFEIFRWIVRPLARIRPGLAAQYARKLALILERLDHDEPRWWRELPP